MQFLAEKTETANGQDTETPLGVLRATPPTATAIQDWLLSQLSALLALPPDEIDIREPFASYGLGSTELVTLSGELEEWLGRKLSPALAYEYPTIATLARHLAGDFGTVAFTDQGQAATSEPIAIIGIGCRFPGAHGLAAFWQLLRAGVDAITEVPPERFDLGVFYDPDPAVPGTINTRWGGFLEQVDQFDPHFFGISPREAVHMDPQQRLLLEVAWEALEDAGQALERLAGTSTGVFIGIATNDYGRIQLSDPKLIDAYAGTGNAFSIAANRLSYVFDFRGPSLALDTACSSSLVAVHLACQSLWNGESTLALAGGVNLILSPAITINFTKAGAMAPDGRCKAFDARANGYVRSEGAGVVVLKPLARALADGDPIYAIIRGSAVNQDGRSNGLMAPNPLAQEAVLREAYRRAGVPPHQVQYVEAHGTGTFLGDPIEAKALGAVLAADRPAGCPCAIGSVKTNLGHLEAAAGIAGLIKVALSLKHRQLPPSLHFQEPNPHIPFDTLPLRVQTVLTPWPDAPGPALAGVSSFGFGGTNAHVVLQEAPPSLRHSEPQGGYETNNGPPVTGPQQSVSLLPISARSPEVLQTLARAYQDCLSAQDATASLQDLCFTASVRRSHHDHRLTVTGYSGEELRACLEAFRQGEARLGLSSGRTGAGRRRKLVLVFPGQGSQWFGMGRRLLEREPVFRETLEQCDKVIRLYADWSVLQTLTTEAASSRLNEVEVIQPTLFAIQVALTALWRSWSVVPDAVVGHSMGEVAAAYVAGALSLADAARVICHRSRLAKRLSGQGAMAVVDLSFTQARHALAGYEDRVSIAASNSPTSTVLSGDPAAVRAILEHLQRQDIFCRLVNVDFASHSPQMDLLRADLLRALDELHPHAAALPLYSTVTGTVSDGLTFDATYWARNLREPVLFSTAVQQLRDDGHDIFLEISPHPILLSAIQQGLQHTNTLPSLRRDEDEQFVMRGSLGTLYTLGYPVDWSRLYPSSSRCVSLPSYPWQRERCWLDTTPAAPGDHPRPHQSHPQPGPHPLGEEVRHEAQQVSGLDEWCYELQWQPKDGVPALPSSLTAAGVWLIFADQSGIGRELAALAHAAGEESVLIWPGEAYAHLASTQCWLRPGQREDVQQLLAAVLGPDHPPCRGIVHLWSLDPPPQAATPASSLEVAQTRDCGSVLAFVQELSQEERTDCPRLWLVTRGAQAAAPIPAALAVAQAPLWGFGRAIAQEHPTLWGGLVDLEPDASPQDSAAHLWEAISHPDGEDQLAFRHGQRYVARLVRTRPPTEQRPAFRWRSDGTYLITGGLGDLGLLVARWMVEQGARRLILLGRTQLPPRVTWSGVDKESRLARQIGAIRELEALGASVHLGAVDVADEGQLRGFLDEFRAEGWPPIRGVVHLAGIAQEQTLSELNPVLFNSVLHPKMTGSWLLHCLLQDDPVDFFVLFSSTASLLGVLGQGQGSYAAANAFMDALAHHRQLQGLPALSINWGPWAQIGLAARHERTERLARRGIESIAPEQGVAALARLWQARTAQIAVMPVNWPRLRDSFASVDNSPLLTCLLSEDPDALPATDGAPETALVTRALLLAAPPEERTLLVQSYLSAQVARVLGLSTARFDGQQPLNTLGLDSLMAVELKNRIAVDLGVQVSVVEFLQGLNVEQVASQVLSLLATSASDAVTSTQNLFSNPDRALTPNLASDTFSPLSYGQGTIWFLYQLAPEVASYVVPVAAHIRSTLDVPVLRHALQALIDRHASLRTTYTSQGGIPMQHVHASVALDFQEEQVAGWSEAELQERLVQEINRPFDLTNGPLLRVHLFTRSAQDRTLLLTVHHIAIDFWSLNILLKELRTLYLAEKSGIEVSLPALPAQYTDYVAWQARLIASPEGERLWTYWQQQLAGRLPVLTLPTDRPRPPVQTYHGAPYKFRLDAELVDQLKALARAEGATLYMTLLAAFYALLHRYSGQDVIVVGAPAVGRGRAEFEGIVGYFANPLPLPADLADHPSFTQLLRQVCQMVVGALEHQDFPGELLLERLHLPRDPSCPSLFQVLFGWDKPHRLEEPRAVPGLASTESWISVENLTTTSFALECQETLLDLVVIVFETESSLPVLIQYNTDLFTAATIERMARHFQTLLRGIVMYPHQSISTLPLLTATEQQQLVVEWNSTQAPYPHDKCMHELFQAQVEQTPEAVAVVFDNEQFTYQELNCRANQVAHQLRRLGVGPEVLVGICMERSWEMVVGLLGILKAGGAYVPLDPTYPQERLAFMVEDTQTSILLTQQRLVQTLPTHRARVLCLDAEWGTIAQESTETPAVDMTADNLAYVIYTSGSTGKPKGVLITQQNLVHSISARTIYYREPVTSTLLFSSFAFDSSVASIFWTLCQGGALCLAPQGLEQDPATLQTVIASQRISHLLSLPSLYELILTQAPPQALASLRTVIVGGEPCPGSLAKHHYQQLPHVPLFNEYGPTEGTVWSSVYHVGSATEDAQVPIGQPIPNTQIYLLDDRLQPVPIGVPGELYIGGHGVASGYLHQPELTAERFVPDPFGPEPGSRLYRTGDLARYLPDGNLVFLGRADHQVKIRGFRIELGEIEAVLSQHPAVENTAVLARGDESGHKSLVAYVVLTQDQAPTIEVLRSFLKEKLPDYMVPSAFVLLDALPLTPSGKVDRQALPAPNRVRPDLQRDFLPPRNDLELQLTQIWEEVLDVRPVGVRDNFFELGGHSLLSVQLFALIEQRLNRTLPLTVFFQNPTVEHLANALSSQGERPRQSALVTLQLGTGGSRRPFFIVHAVDGTVLPYLQLASHLDHDQPFYGLQVPGLTTREPLSGRIEDMALHYVTVLRSVQPEGPYFLGGWSMGGLLALEMAQQLLAQGHKTALLVLLDSWISTTTEKQQGEDRYRALLSTYSQTLGFSFDPEVPLSQMPREVLTHLAEQARQTGLLHQDVSLPQDHSLLQIFETNSRAMWQYGPRPYPGRIILFRAHEQLVDTPHDPMLGWGEWATAGLEVYDVPGNHYTMLRQPHVAALAQHLQSCLDQAQAAERTLWHREQKADDYPDDL